MDQETSLQNLSENMLEGVMKSTNDMLKELLQKSSDYDTRELNFEEKIRQLQKHIAKVKRRGHAAMAYVRHLKDQGLIIPTDQTSSIRPLPTGTFAKDTASFTAFRKLNTCESSSGQESDTDEEGSSHGKRKRARKLNVAGLKARMQEGDPIAENVREFKAESSFRSPVQATNNADLEAKENLQNVSSTEAQKPDASPQSVSAPKKEPASPPPSLKAEPESPKLITAAMKTEETPYECSELPDLAVEQKELMSTDCMTSATQRKSSSSVQAITAVDKEHLKEAGDAKTKTIFLRDASGSESEWRQKLHPYPDTPFPAELPSGALSKNVPQKLLLTVVRMTDTATPSICLMWEVIELDPDAPEMDSYYIYACRENLEGNFSRWNLIGHISATELPMACRLSDYNSHQRLCFIIVGKDRYGRYGPYSDVQCIYAKSVNIS